MGLLPIFLSNFARQTNLIMRHSLSFYTSLLLGIAFSANTSAKVKVPMSASRHEVVWDTPGALNPFIPGYFADPTIRKFGDTYYVYATTDGTGNGYGPAQVWVSKDFRNWKNVILNWPTTEVVWAPDVVQQNDTTFRYYYCEPCMVHAGESSSPLGPWTNILGKTDAVLVPDRYVHNAITLDPQLFRDDDGQEYLYFGTWGIYKGFGCGVARLNPDWKKGDSAESFFADRKLIENTEITDFFEAPFIFKKDGLYYFTYSSGSCHDDTYRVQYATATNPMGPYTYKGCILRTNADGTVHGPGHHSILVDGEDYYIIYHRHNNPHSLHGFHRQLCIDRMTFDAEGNINTIAPTHEGPLVAAKGGAMDFPLARKSKKDAVNLAYGAKVTASSYYSEWFRPEYATDDNNGTLWKAAHTNWDHTSGQTPEWIVLDMGKPQQFNQVWTSFEFATFYYQYKIETSLDSVNWSLYADRSTNTTAGSPMIDEKPVRARYVRLSITDTQKNGHFPAVWNVKVYNATKKNNPKNLLPDTSGMDLSAVEQGYPTLHTPDVAAEQRTVQLNANHTIIDINADDCAQNGANNVSRIINRSGGYFMGDGNVRMEVKAGKTAFYFNGKNHVRSSNPLPAYMAYNSPYTIEAWTLNPSVSAVETVLSVSAARNDLATTEFRLGSDRQNGLIAHNGSFENSGAQDAITKGAGTWQHWVITYDGYMERMYLNGELLQEKNNFIMIRPRGSMVLGASADGGNAFTGYVHSLRLLSRSMTGEEVKEAYQAPSSTTLTTTYDHMPEVLLDRLSPDHLRLSLMESNGDEVNTGLYRFSFAVSNGSRAVPESSLTFTKPDNLSSVVLSHSVQSGPIKVYTRAYDDNDSIVLSSVTNFNLARTTYNTIHHQDEMRLSTTTGDHFNDNPLENGATVLAHTTGDCLVQARITGIDGEAQRRTPAYNEGGIILSDGKTSVHLGVFPAYDCGNMLTVLSQRGRPQFPNGKGWDYDPWIQLQRKGDKIHARTSTDGITWTEMSGSPVTYPSGADVSVGVYQTTYNRTPSWVSLDNVSVYTAK